VKYIDREEIAHGPPIPENCIRLQEQEGMFVLRKCLIVILCNCACKVHVSKGVNDSLKERGGFWHSGWMLGAFFDSKGRCRVLIDHGVWPLGSSQKAEENVHAVPKYKYRVTTLCLRWPKDDCISTGRQNNQHTGRVQINLTRKACHLGITSSFNETPPALKPRRTQPIQASTQSPQSYPFV
jgi:hypothetical protein